MALSSSSTALSYSFISGVRASILTDYWQMWFILVVVVVVVPWIVSAGGGWQTVLDGIGGISGKYSNPFNAEVAYSFGIVVTIGLLAGPFGDQSFWQRTFATKKKEIKKQKLISIVSKLNNTNFIEKAPENVIENFKLQEKDLKSSIEKIDQIINTIN